MKRSISFCIVALFLIWAFGCSKSTPNPVAPSGDTGNPSSNVPALTGAAEPSNSGDTGYGHSLLGYWDVVVNPDIPSIEFVPLRTSEMHLNTIKFLEGAQMNVSLGSKPVNDNGTLYAQIVLKHPFAGALQFCGFDVKGIFLSQGSETGFSDSELKIAGAHETRLINADGFTRWWNPKEFLGSGLFGYIPGKLGHPLDPSKAAILNGYKLFADGLAADAGLDTLDVQNRALFTAGATLSRDYVISLAGGVKFNYAVDASWAPPSPNPPSNVPGDFPIAANAEEPWWFEVTETLNTLWYAGSKHGGNAFYDVTIHDWQGSDTIETVTFGSPGLFNTIATDPDSSTANTASYHFEVILPDLKSSDPIDVLISVGCPGYYQPSQTGVDKPLKGYYRHITQVSNVDPVFNTPPIASMYATTPTDILLDDSVSFDGTASYDPDGAIVEYLWDFNGNGIFGEESYDGDAKTPTYTYTKTGVYNVKLKVRDNSGTSTTSDPVAVSVTLESNDPPVALAHATSATNINQGGSVNFDGTESYDLDGTVVDWQWDFNGDGFFGDPFVGDMQTPNASFPLTGTYYVNLKVVDDSGGFDTLDTKIKVTVKDLPNTSPVADAVATDPTDINDCGAIAFDASGSSDVDGFIAKYEWDFNGDGTYGDPYNSGTSENPTKIFLKSGVYNVGLMVTDNEDATDVLDTSIVVTVTNVGPVADAIATTSTEIGACESVSFDATGSYDPDCTDISLFEWDFDGDGIYGDAFESGTADMPTKAFENVGDHEVMLKVTDSDDATDLIDTPIVVSVSNIDPIANAEAVTTTYIETGGSITFDGSISEDPDCQNIVSYKWDFDGDGTFGDAYDSGTDDYPTKIFTEIGEFDVWLKVTDNNAASDTTDQGIHIVVSPNPPDACAEITNEWPFMWKTPIEFSAECSTDDGTIELYEWDLGADGSYEKTGEIVTFQFDTAGDYVMQLRVTDNDGAQDILDDQIEFQIFDDTNIPPMITKVNHSRTTSLKNSSAEKVGLSVDFVDPVPPGDTHTYLWTCPYGSFDDATSATPNWTPPNQIVKCQITVRVTDSQGGWDEDTCNQWVTQWAVMANPNSPNGTDIVPYTMKDILTDLNVEVTSFSSPVVPPDGNVVYFNFWATTCPYCKEELPDLTVMHDLYEGQNYVQIMIDVNDTEATAQAYIESHDNTADYWLLDAGNYYFFLCNNWNGDQNGIPQHEVFDRDGNCRGAVYGGIHGVGIGYLTKYIDELI